MAFWRRKSKDQFVTLGLNEPRVETAEESASSQSATAVKPQPQPSSPHPATIPDAAAPEPVITGAGPTPLVPEKREVPKPSPQPQPDAPSIQPPKVPSRSPFATSVLGLNLSIEELQAQEAALEQEFSARFRRAVAATRDNLSERLDTVFQGLKTIDENLLDELEEALIAADIGVVTTQQ